MKADEVIADRALELLGHEKGEYQYLHPIKHVNMSHSNYEVYPTALRLAACFAVQGLLHAMEGLRTAFVTKANKLDYLLKTGPSQLQETPLVTLGQALLTYAATIGANELRLAEATALLCEVNLEATAIGTGINTDSRYSKLVVDQLSLITGLVLTPAPNMIEAAQDAEAFVQISVVLKRIAVKLLKICDELRVLSSGAVNPIAPEVVGDDTTDSMTAEGGQLQFNALGPVAALDLIKSLAQLTAGCHALAEHCNTGITAERVLATTLSPYIGCENATLVAKRSLTGNRPVVDLVKEMGLMWG